VRLRADVVEHDRARYAVAVVLHAVEHGEDEAAGAGERREIGEVRAHLRAALGAGVDDQERPNGIARRRHDAILDAAPIHVA
jgi:hypothetical protein